MLVPLTDLFEIRNGNSLELLSCDQDAKGLPFISRSSANNGMVCRVIELDDVQPMAAYCITVALGGSVLSSFFQTEAFYTSFHIQCLYPKVKLSQQEMLYYCAAIEANKYRYNYGRQANKTLKQIKVPSPSSISSTIKTYRLDNVFDVSSTSDTKIALNTQSWSWFNYSDIFNITTSKDNNLVEAIDGNTPYISSTQMKNGVSQWINAEPSQESNTITVARNGSVGSAFYQPIEYVASPDDVRIFSPKFKMNKYIGIFLTTLIEQEKYRYAYGRKFGTKRMQSSKIKLPVTPTGEPDWLFMENYIKSLPYSSNL